MEKKFILIIILIIFLLTFSACFGSRIVGNKESKVLHFTSCYYAKKIKSSHKVYFRSIEDGLKKGYSVCDKCIDIEKK